MDIPVLFGHQGVGSWEIPDTHPFVMVPGIHLFAASSVGARPGPLVILNTQKQKASA